MMREIDSSGGTSFLANIASACATRAASASRLVWYSFVHEASRACPGLSSILPANLPSKRRRIETSLFCHVPVAFLMYILELQVCTGSLYLMPTLE